MKHLLEKWATLEPSLCRHERDTFALPTTPDGKWWGVITETSHMQIQWTVQQAIIEKGWYFEMYYTPSTYNEAIITVPSKAKAKAYSQNSMAEALLDSYLKVLNANS